MILLVSWKESTTKDKTVDMLVSEEILLTSAKKEKKTGFKLILINVFQELRFWINPKGRKLHYIHCTKNEVFHKRFLQ